MKKIECTTYLEQLISARGDGNIKVISGLRRCGKSYVTIPVEQFLKDPDSLNL